MTDCCHWICCPPGASGSVLVSEHCGLGDKERYYLLAVSRGKFYVAKYCSWEVKKKTFQFRCPSKSCSSHPHCNKTITIIKHLFQPKSIPKSFAPIRRPAANKALNLKETFLQLLIKYNTAKFHLQHIILIMGMEIIHSIAIQNNSGRLVN